MLNQLNLQKNMLSEVAFLYIVITSSICYDDDDVDDEPPSSVDDRMVTIMINCDLTLVDIPIKTVVDTQTEVKH